MVYTVLTDYTTTKTFKDWYGIIPWILLDDGDRTKSSYLIKTDKK
jgi:hypothetical protein